MRLPLCAKKQAGRQLAKDSPERTTFAESVRVDAQVEQANDYGHGDEERDGNVWIHGRVQVVQKEWAAVSRDGGAGLAPVFEERERARYRSRLGDDGPENCSDVKGGKARASARENRAEDHPSDVEQVRDERRLGQDEIGFAGHGQVSGEL
jgi:hypothetical protein